MRGSRDELRIFPWGRRSTRPVHKKVSVVNANARAITCRRCDPRDAPKRLRARLCAFALGTACLHVETTPHPSPMSGSISRSWETKRTGPGPRSRLPVSVSCGSLSQVRDPREGDPDRDLGMRGEPGGALAKSRPL